MPVTNPNEEYQYLTKLIKEELDRAQKFLNFCITIVMALIGGLLLILREESLTSSQNTQYSFIFLLHIIPTIILIFQLLYLRPILNYGRVVAYIVNNIELGLDKLNYFTTTNEDQSDVLKFGSILVSGGMLFFSLSIILILIISGLSLELIDYLTASFVITGMSRSLICFAFAIYVTFILFLSYFISKGLIEVYSPRPKEKIGILRTIQVYIDANPEMAIIAIEKMNTRDGSERKFDLSVIDCECKENFEANAVRLALKYLPRKTNVILHCDKEGDVEAIKKGKSKNEDLQRIISEIKKIETENGLSVEYRSIPRKQNYVGRILDKM